MPFIHRLFAILLLAVAVALPAAAKPAAEKPATDKPVVAEAPLVVFNRTVFVFRSEFFGLPPSARATRAGITLEAILDKGGEQVVTVKDNPEGQFIMIDGTLAFGITPGDVDPLTQETLPQAAARAAQALERVIAETREARSVNALLKAIGFSLLATAIFALLLWGLTRLRRRAQAYVMALAERKASALRVGGTQVLESQHLLTALRRLMTLVLWLLVALLAYEWLSFVLSRFPYTRPWGESLNDYFVSVAGDIFGAVIGAIPGLGVALAIFMIARFSVLFLGRFLERLARGSAPPSWLGTDTMPTTRRLFAIGIWLFTLAMAYPYLPGSDTEAFKGLSVLLGLMVSLGASSVVGQAASGLILTYTRTLHVGEYVRIAEHEGTVTRMGAFTTTIRTGLGEELTIPNSLITGAVTKNYSRSVQGRGYVVDTTVTIGYDTPWRQVEAMLIEASRRTPGILETPTPRVFQTALSDFYPEYRLVAQAVPSQPRPRAEVLSALHANIQDVFNEYGVQIMSPHYLGDPAQAKMVKREDWHLPPARPDDAPAG
jgi:small-conductance mechanosensitive channel